MGAAIRALPPRIALPPQNCQSTFTRDNNGNLTNDGSKTYTYTQANRLTAVSGTGLSWSATYNGDGARLKQVVNSVPTTYTQDLAAPLPVVLQAKTGTTATLYLFDIGTRPLAEYDSAWEYLLPDGLGSLALSEVEGVRQLVDAGGNVKLTESYEPYGSVLSSQGSATSVFGFTGEQLDSYTQLIFLRARYMQPTLGVFLSRDPLGDSVGRSNGFNYAGANPVNQTDPAGLCPLSAGGCPPLSLVYVQDAPDVASFGGLALRKYISLEPDSIIKRLPIGTMVMTTLLGPRRALGRWWQYVVEVDGSGRGFVPEWNLEANPQIEYLSQIKPAELEFAANPVSGPYDYMGGLGANKFAYDNCSNREAGCPYKWTRGLHNGIDFGVPIGTPVYWTANIKGKVHATGYEYPDATPNVTVDAGRYRVVFGHLSQWSVTDNQDVTPGTRLGSSGASGDPHLHMGIREGDNYQNPAFFFSVSARMSWEQMEYVAGQSAASMKSFSMSGVAKKFDKFYWSCGDTPGDVTGIVW